MTIRPRKTIFAGNPGSGKSALLNAVIGEPVFLSGLSIGSGLTSTMQMEEVDGEYFGDTPGLDDVKKREQAAQEIAKALRHGKGMYRLVFVVTEDDLRVRPTDLATMELVLDAVNTELKQDYPFGIIVNKMEPKVKEYLETNKEALADFKDHLRPGEYTPSNVLLYPRIEELVAGRNTVHTPRPALIKFLDDLRSVFVKPKQVKDIAHEKFEELQENYGKLLEENLRMKKWLVVASGVAALAVSAVVTS